ncbi:hypothetical protein PoB_005971700 [Plakobranchus ocellatus]|uniref:Uncharacterized protein n=1 Tax=Plakobranchus ocellatus TaxID=259542 RepID=A0AAV4CN30_9GAST|nr:hypothetical protein PoB_005971700 [Plakobranchus ocellatus]
MGHVCPQIMSKLLIEAAVKFSYQKLSFALAAQPLVSTKYHIARLPHHFLHKEKSSSTLRSPSSTPKSERSLQASRDPAGTGCIKRRKQKCWLALGIKLTISCMVSKEPTYCTTTQSMQHAERASEAMGLSIDKKLFIQITDSTHHTKTYVRCYTSSE